jgi:hypothetical protein
MKKILLLFLVHLLCIKGFSQLYINEILVANASVNIDMDYRDFSSWIEIYNSSASPINLSGFYLSDSKKNPSKWIIPNATTVPANGFVIFWTDKNNYQLHTNFGLDANGEFIGLYNPSKQLIDSFSFPDQYSNISYGRSPDGSAVLKYYGKPTPGASNTTPAATVFASKPVFSPKGGFYTSSQSLTLTNVSPTAKIYYTTDGSEPLDSTNLYTTPISITQNTSVRARVYDDGFLPSDIVTQTFFINETTTVPVISVSVPPKFIMDNAIGIFVGAPYYNYRNNWERPANVEFFMPNDTAAFSAYCGIQNFGLQSRGYPQKPMDVSFKNKYGADKINYGLFFNRSYNDYHGFVIRNSGYDWKDGGTNDGCGIMFRDAFQHVIPIGQMDIDVMSYRPAIVFLNGEYWGITDLREKNDKYYCNSNFPVIDKDSVDIIKQSVNGVYELIDGDTVLMKQFFTYIKTQDMSVAANYKIAQDSMDIREFINYMIVETQSCNMDWLYYNIKLWRQPGLTKWRWMLFDLDRGFNGMGITWNSVAYNRLWDAVKADTVKASNMYKWTSIVLGSLLKNKDFKNEFAQTYAAHLNTTYQAKRVNYIIDSIENIIKPEIQRHIDKWGSQGSTASMTSWNTHVQWTHDFANQRSPYSWSNVKSVVGMFNMANVKIRKTYGNMGNVYIQGATMYDSIMAGPYFNNIPLELSAQANPGYVFNWWEKKQGGVKTYFRPALIKDVLSSSGPDSIFYTAIFSKTQLDSFILMVNGGNGSGLYLLNKVVSVNAVPSVAKKDKYFVKWTGDVTVMADENDSATIITMPNTDVAVTATFSHQLTVVGGSGSGIYAPQAVVSVKANTPPAGKVFDKWIGDVTGLANIYDSVTTLSMSFVETRITVTYKTASGINEYNNHEFTIFPNPVSDELNVLFNTPFFGTICIIDLTGNTLLTNAAASDHVKINVWELPSGLYMVSAKNDKTCMVRKFIKN